MSSTLRIPASYLGSYRRHVDLQRVASAVCPA
jgi:hypothetical protein